MIYWSLKASPIERYVILLWNNWHHYTSLMRMGSRYNTRDFLAEYVSILSEEAKKLLTDFDASDYW